MTGAAMADTPLRTSMQHPILLAIDTQIERDEHTRYRMRRHLSDTNDWVLVHRLELVRRYGQALLFIGEHLYLVRGQIRVAAPPLPAQQFLRLNMRTWQLEDLPSMLKPKRGTLTATHLNGAIYVMGNVGGGALSLEKYTHKSLYILRNTKNRSLSLRSDTILRRLNGLSCQHSRMAPMKFAATN